LRPSVDCRLRTCDNVKAPLECVKDAKSSIRYLRKNAEKLKVDPDKIVQPAVRLADRWQRPSRRAARESRPLGRILRGSRREAGRIVVVRRL